MPLPTFDEWKTRPLEITGPPFMVDFIGQLDRPRLEHVPLGDHDVYQGD